MKILFLLLDFLLESYFGVAKINSIVTATGRCFERAQVKLRPTNKLIFMTLNSLLELV
jgi:hypothetical protein